MSPLTILAIFASGLACLAGLYFLGDLLYGIGLEHGLMRNGEERIRRRLIAGGVNVEFELDRIAAQVARKRAALAALATISWPRKRPLPPTFDRR